MGRLRPHRLSIGLVLLASCAQTTAAEPARPETFDAPMVVALTDADMVPSAYVNGRLGPPAGTDKLTVLRFGGPSLHPTSVSDASVGNSVTGPPAPMAISPDGRYAIVVETRGPRPTSGVDVGLSGLSKSRAITVVDLSNAPGPEVVQSVEGPSEAVTVSISPDGRTVAIGVGADGNGHGTPLWLYRFDGGRLADGRAVEIPGWIPGDELTAATCAPNAARLAIVDQTRDTLALYDVSRSDGSYALTRWGNVVVTERFPFVAKFSPDGRFAFVNAYYAGGPTLKPPFMYPPGTVSAVRLDAQRDGEGRPVHVVTAHQPVGRGPEGLAVSPDGRLIVSVNMEGSYFPEDDPRRTRYSTLTLLRLDPSSGALERVDEPAFDGLLPESAVFDRDGSHLAVANFGRFDDPRGAGSVDIWRVVSDPQDRHRVRLVQTRESTALGRGVMELAVAGPR